VERNLVLCHFGLYLADWLRTEELLIVVPSGYFVSLLVNLGKGTAPLGSLRSLTRRYRLSLLLLVNTKLLGLLSHHVMVNDEPLNVFLSRGKSRWPADVPLTLIWWLAKQILILFRLRCVFFRPVGVRLNAHVGRSTKLSRWSFGVFWLSFNCF
jgi:hypothetical protein